jgi:hypothetical protein
MAKTKKKPDFQAGIRELAWVDPKTLTSNVLNWKKHPHRQRQAIDAAIEVNGWAGALLFNEVTGNLLDGHMRKEQAIKRGDEAVPVLIGSWSPEQERHILASLDTIGAMFETQAEALAALTESVQSNLEHVKTKLTSQHREALNKLTSDIDSYAQAVTSGEAASVMLGRKRDRKEYDRNRAIQEARSEEATGSISRTELVADVIFPSSNSFGIPDLRKDLLCPDHPALIWDRSNDTLTPDSYFCYSAGPSTIPRSGGGGFLGFFTEDFRFETCWNDTPKFTEWLRSMDFRGALVPDFSTWTDWPFAVRLHQLYKSRWVARYWQEAGIPIIPIVQSLGTTDFDDGPEGQSVDPEDSLSATLCLHSLPEKTPVLATEARNHQGEEDYWPGWVALHRLALEIVKPKVLVVYGGEQNAKYFLPRLPKTKTKIVLLSSFISQRRKGQK